MFYRFVFFGIFLMWMDHVVKYVDEMAFTHAVVSEQVCRRSADFRDSRKRKSARKNVFKRTCNSSFGKLLHMNQNYFDLWQKTTFCQAFVLMFTSMTSLSYFKTKKRVITRIAELCNVSFQFSQLTLGLYIYITEQQFELSLVLCQGVELIVVNWKWKYLKDVREVNKKKFQELFPCFLLLVLLMCQFLILSLQLHYKCKLTFKIFWFSSLHVNTELDFFI